MSVPMSHEDLQKLRSFIEFVGANPTILNSPPLDFVKKFIEQFGGKVPEGEFQIPAGGKCPFGGDAGSKKEPAPEMPESDESEPDDADADIDFEPESELELDMEANTDVGVDGEGVENDYAEEEDDDDEEEIKMTPRKRRATKRQTASKPTRTRKKIEIVKRKQQRILRETVKIEPCSDVEIDELQQEEHINVVDDALVEIEHKPNLSTRSSRRSHFKEEFVYDENLLRKRVKRDKRTKLPRSLICFENCKYQCNMNFDAKQRKLLCSQYWAMNEMERDEFLRTTIMLHKTRRICQQKTDRPRREFMCRYFLRAKDGQERGVCSVFYMATLSLKSSIVKDMLSTIWEQQKLNTIKQDQAIEMITEEHLEFDMETEVPPSLDHDIIQHDDDDDDADEEAKTTSCQVERNEARSAEKRKLDLSRQLRPANCEAFRCRLNCTSKISEEQREKLCSAFWALDFRRRKDYLIAHVQSHAILTKTVAEFMKSNRPRSHQNHFFLRNERGENVRVCSRFFTATLSLGSNYISRTLRRSDPITGTYIGDDMRGRKEPYNKTSPELREAVKRHIESYPTWVPNKRSKTSYLHNSLSVQRMFNEYKEKCIAMGQKFVNSTYFRRVFREDFRLAFLRPNVVSPQRIGTAKRNPECSGTEKIKKIKAPNQFLSEYTGEEGGFWTATTKDELISFESPIKEVTVTTTIERADCYHPTQNAMFATATATASTADEVVCGSDNSDNLPTGAFIRFTPYTTEQQQIVQHIENIDLTHQTQSNLHAQQIVLIDHSHSQQQQQQLQQQQHLQLEHSTQELAASGLINAQFSEHDQNDVYRII